MWVVVWEHCYWYSWPCIVLSWAVLLMMSSACKRRRPPACWMPMQCSQREVSKGIPSCALRKITFYAFQWTQSNNEGMHSAQKHLCVASNTDFELGWQHNGRRSDLYIFTPYLSPTPVNENLATLSRRLVRAVDTAQIVLEFRCVTMASRDGSSACLWCLKCVGNVKQRVKL